MHRWTSAALFTASMALFASLPLSSSWSPSSSWPQLTTTSDAAAPPRHARVGKWRPRRVIVVLPQYYAEQDGHGGYPYSSGYYAYRDVYAPPTALLGGRPQPQPPAPTGYCVLGAHRYPVARVLSTKEN